MSKPIKNLDTLISLNNDTIIAYNELKQIISTLYDTCDTLRYTPGLINDNVFDARMVYLVSNTSVDAGIYMGVTAENGTPIGNFNLSVSQLAQSQAQQTIAFPDKTSSVTQASGGIVNPHMFTEGTFTLNNVPISVSQGDSLLDIAAEINYVSSQTGVSATLFAPMPGQVRMILQSKQTGVVNAYTIVDSNNVWNQVLQYDAVLNPNCNLRVAQDCIINYNGIQDIQRPTNSIDDCFDGLTITAYQTTPNGTAITVDITYDINSITEGVQNFVDAYNNLVKFTALQQQKDMAGNYLESAKIRDGSALSGFLSAAEQYLGSFMNKNRVYQTIFDVGLNFVDVAADFTTGEPDYYNLLSLDSDTFQECLKTSFDDVRHMFECYYNTSSAKMLPTKSRSNNLPTDVSNMVMNINVQNNTNPIVTLSYMKGGNSNSVPMIFQYFDLNNAASGGTIRGQTSSVLDGFTFIYIGSGLDNIAFTIQQGVADLIYNSLGTINSDGGMIDAIQEAIRVQNIDYESDKESIQADIEKTKQSMLRRFTEMDASISKTNSQLSFIDAMTYVRDR